MVKEFFFCCCWCWCCCKKKNNYYFLALSLLLHRFYLYFTVILIDMKNEKKKRVNLLKYKRKSDNWDLISKQSNEGERDVFLLLLFLLLMLLLLFCGNFIIFPFACFRNRKKKKQKKRELNKKLDFTIYIAFFCSIYLFWSEQHSTTQAVVVKKN